MRSAFVSTLLLLFSLMGLLIGVASCGGDIEKTLEGETDLSESVEKETAPPAQKKDEPLLASDSSLLGEWQEPLWVRDSAVVQDFMGTGCLAGDYLLRCSWDQHLYVYDAVTGLPVKRLSFPGVPLGGPLRASGEGKSAPVFFFTDNGYWLRWDEESLALSLEARIPLTEPLQTEPLWDGQYLYGADGMGLFAWDTLTQEFSWREEVLSLVHGLALSPEYLFAQQESAFVTRERMTGKEVWAQYLSSLVAPVAAGGRVYGADQTSEEARVFIFDEDTGRQIGEIPFSGIIWELILGDERLLVVQEDPEGSRLYGLDQTTGQIIWKHRFDLSTLFVSPREEGFYLGREEGQLGVFHTNSGTGLWQYGFDQFLAHPPLAVDQGVYLFFPRGEMAFFTAHQETRAAYARFQSETENQEGTEGGSSEEDSPDTSEGPDLRGDGKVRRFTLGDKPKILTVMVDERGSYNFFAPEMDDFPIHFTLLNSQGLELKTNFEHSGLDKGFTFLLEADTTYQLRVEALGDFKKDQEIALVLMPQE